MYVAPDKKGKKKRKVKGGGEMKKPLTRDPEEYSEVMRKERAVESPLAAFVVKPKKVRFETQDPEEHVLLLLRKHVVTNLDWILLVMLFLVMPILIVGWVDLSWLPTNYGLVAVVGWYLATLGYGFENFLAWYFNVYIITDERIIDYDFYSLLYKRVSEAKIDRIEDVTYEMGGAAMSILNYGTVYIQTAGEQREIDFGAVPRPEVVVKLLNELALEEEREKIEGRVR